jgi:hypothetical protein
VRYGDIAGNQFIKRGVARGDYIYVVTVRQGHLYLIWRLYVGGILDHQQAKERFGGDIWETEQYVVGQ